MRTLIKRNGEWKQTCTFLKKENWPVDITKLLDWSAYLNVPVNGGTSNYVTLSPDKTYLVIIQLSTNDDWAYGKNTEYRTGYLIVKNNTIINKSDGPASWLTYQVANNRVTVTNTNGTFCGNLTAIPVKNDFLNWSMLPNGCMCVSLSPQQRRSITLDADRMYYIENTICLSKEQQSAARQHRRTGGYLFHNGQLTQVSSASDGTWYTISLANNVITLLNTQDTQGQYLTVSIIDITELNRITKTYIKVNNNGGGINEWVKRLFLFCALLVVCLSVAPAQTNELSQKSSTIKEKLIDLKVNSAIVTEQLKTVSEDLTLSQNEAKQWKERSMNLSNSLTSINEQLNDCYTTITKQSSQNRLLMKVLTILIAILGLRTVGMILGYILYAKGIKLPRWLDILL